MSGPPTDTSNWTNDDWLIQRYKYIPSQPAAIIFTILFAITTTFHGVQLTRWRTWYFIPFFIGGLFETAGYIQRAIDTSAANKILFINQTSLILLAPALYAASIYMILKRLILLLDAESYSLVRVAWLTRFFVGCDVLSFLTQGAGGAMLASNTKPGKQDIGNYLTIGGLVLQLVVFAFFVVVVGTFHWRIVRKPTVRSETVQVPWMKYIYVLYGVSGLVMIRSMFRVVEYVQGREGYLMSHEVFGYVLDAALMLAVSMVFNVWHPSRIVSRRESSGAHMLLKNVDLEENTSYEQRRYSMGGQ